MEGSAKKEGSGLFRPEALEHRASQKGSGDVVRIAPRWTTVAFYALVAAFLVAVVAMTLIEVDRYVRGAVATDDAGRLVVLVPAEQAPDVPVGALVDLGSGTTEVVQIEARVLDPDQVAARFGMRVTGPVVAVVTSADGGDAATIARIRVEREPVIVALVPGLKSLLGGSDG